MSAQLAQLENRLQVAAEASQRLLRRLVEERVFPGATLALAARDTQQCAVVCAGAFTYELGSSEVASDTLFDLASVTKVVAALGVSMTLVADGTLALETRVGDLIRAWSGGHKDEVTVAHLLSHTSGLAAHEPFYLEHSSREAVRQAVKQAPLLAVPGSRCVYSDLGIILLGEVLEAMTQTDFKTLVQRRVLKPLGLANTMFVPPPMLRARIAPTEDDGWRGVVVHGVVHDENAYAMGGIAPHAGLFSTAADVAAFGRGLLADANPRLVADEVVRLFTTLPAHVPGPWTFGVRILGGDPLFGQCLSPQGFGATGFTGTMLAVDPERGLAIALLSNRVYPTRENRGIFPARGLVLDCVLKAYDGAS